MAKLPANSNSVSAFDEVQDILAFQAQASEVLSLGPDIEIALVGLARLVVSRLATWCAIDLANSQGAVHRVALAVHEPDEFEATPPTLGDIDEPPELIESVHQAFHTGIAQLLGDVDDVLKSRTTPSSVHWRPLHHADIISAMAVPLKAGDRLLGAISFVSRERDRRYNANDLALAQDLAQRAAMAVETLARRPEAGPLMNDKKQAMVMLEGMLNHATVGIGLLDVEARVLRINQILAGYAGLPIEAHIGRRLSEVLPKVWEAIDFHFKRAVATGHPETGMEIHVETPARPGQPCAYQASCYPVHGVDGALAGVGVVIIEITQRKRAEKELTAARDSAEAANRAKDQFLAVLSHELRAPLTPVTAAIHTLRMDPSLSPEARNDVEVIRRNVELEARLIDDLLDLTRIAKGKLRLNLEVVDVHTLVASALQFCRPDIQSKNLKVNLRLHANPHEVRGDGARLHQVFWNLIKNAVKFTPHDGNIDITSENEADRIRISIKDNGIGIEPRIIPRIFFAFEYADASVARRFGGLGLGLSISKLLIDMHGGHISASSEGTNRGSMFVVDFAAMTPGQKSTVPARPAAANPANAQALPRKKVRILMVDDHVDTSRALKRLLEKLGYQVRLADSVQSALKELGNQDASGEAPFDLLISDIGLPDGSGLDLMREVRSRSPIKAIALSGFGMEEDIRRSKAAGFVTHLTKPVNFDRLEEVIAELTR